MNLKFLLWPAFIVALIIGCASCSSDDNDDNASDKTFTVSRVTEIWDQNLLVSSTMHVKISKISGLGVNGAVVPVTGVGYQLFSEQPASSTQFKPSEIKTPVDDTVEFDVPLISLAPGTRYISFIYYGENGGKFVSTHEIVIHSAEAKIGFLFKLSAKVKIQNSNGDPCSSSISFTNPLGGVFTSPAMVLLPAGTESQLLEVIDENGNYGDQWKFSLSLSVEVDPENTNLTDIQLSDQEIIWNNNTIGPDFVKTVSRAYKDTNWAKAFGELPIEYSVVVAAKHDGKPYNAIYTHKSKIIPYAGYKP